jgi:hypothetical protein
LYELAWQFGIFSLYSKILFSSSDMDYCVWSILENSLVFWGPFAYYIFDKPA